MKVSGQIHFPTALQPDKEPTVPAELAPAPVWTRWWREIDTLSSVISQILSFPELFVLRHFIYVS
jgi:hypothetical protein